MWTEVVAALAAYPSAVLAARDAEGYPYSLRCLPVADDAAQVLRLDVPPDVPLVAGPASLLCHSHDALLAHQRSVLVRGSLARAGSGWAFTPLHLVPGIKDGDPLALLRYIWGARRTAARYLAARNLPRPRIAWDEIVAVKAQAHPPERTSR